MPAKSRRPWRLVRSKAVGYFAARMDRSSSHSASSFHHNAATFKHRYTEHAAFGTGHGEDAELLNFCEQLRKNGIHHREAVTLEIETLLGCQGYAAVKLMKDWLSHEPADKEMRLNLSAVGLHRDDASLIESDPTKLPSADEIAYPPRGFAIVAVLQNGPEPGGRCSLCLRAVASFSR